MNRDIFILGGARTPMAEYAGKLKDFSALELGAIASRAALERTGVKPEAVDHVVFGNVLQTSCGRGLRRAPRRAEGRPADRSAGAHRESAVRIGHPGRGQRRRS